MGQVRVVDFTGAEIKLAQSAKRIVCLTAAGLDILLELDMEPVGYLTKGVADKPEFYGERAKQFTSVGSWLVPNWKAVRKLNPDLILGWSFPHRFYRRWFGAVRANNSVAHRPYKIGYVEFNFSASDGQRYPVLFLGRGSYLGVKNLVLLLPSSTGRFCQPLNSSRYSSGSSSSRIAASSKSFFSILISS